MRAEPQIPAIPIPEVIERVRQRYFAMSQAQAPMNPFGLHIVRSRIYWRNEISGELGLIAAVPRDDLPVTIAAVLDDLAKLRAGAPLKRKTGACATAAKQTKTLGKRAL